MTIKIREKAFTLVELLIVMAIVVFLVLGLLITLDPIAQTNKGLDARRKRDLARIKVSFEEYYSDKGCYPSGALLDSLNSDNSCDTNVFAPWLDRWPCDPNGGTYNIVVDDSGVCPSWYKILTNLNNKNDNDIPEGWYLLTNFFVGDGTYSTSQVNYGTSSTNVNWFDREVSDNCSGGMCFQRSGPNACQSTRWPSDSCTDPDNCFIDSDCRAECQVTCCNNGLPCD